MMKIHTIELCKILIMLNRVRIKKAQKDSCCTFREKRETYQKAQRSIRFYEQMIEKLEKAEETNDTQS